MHVVDVDGDPVVSQAAAEPTSKGVAVSAAATTTTAEEVETDIKPPISPKVNGVCDTGKDKSRRGSRETVQDIEPKIEKTEIKVEEEDRPAVESSEPHDLTVTCTSSVDAAAPKVPVYPSAKYISISVEQCQSNPQDKSIRNKTVNKPSPSRKRSTKSSDSDESAYKRGRMDDREASVNMMVDQATMGGLEEVLRQAESLQQEIHGLSALARNKELEWNEIIRMKKLKEEMYLRLIRRKQVIQITTGSGSRPPEDAAWDFALENRLSDFITNDEVSLNRVKPRLPSNLTITKSQGATSQQLQRFLMQPQQQGPQMLPGGASVASGPSQARGKTQKSRSAPFPILPKPTQASTAAEQLASIGRQAGLQGATVDVKSIIADHRQAHPESIPRRGRRINKTPVAENLVTSSRGVLSMSSIALGSGSQVRTVGSTSGPEETSRPSSADSSRSDAINWNKDVYVQYAKLVNQTGSKQPPPYPEVTLHPVLPSNSQSPPPHSSLLHGILTKSGPPINPSSLPGTVSGGNGITASAGGATKTTGFSPTLARLLTTPDRPSTTTTITTASSAGGTSSSSPAPVSISELLSTSKARNELTITPVVNNQSAKAKEDTVSGSHEEDGDDQDRLVIDEGEEGDRGDDTENDPPGYVCQGCQQRSAQFVCAGCGNQWYCSRDCQVTAWDEHSEVCSG